MQEEFEKKIRERMHTFGIQPAHQVWDDIDAALNRQKHRRFFVGWWILLGLVLLGGVVVLLDKEGVNNDKLNQQPTITNDTTNNNHFAEKPVTPGIENKASAPNNNNNDEKPQGLANTTRNKINSNAIATTHNNTEGTTQHAAVLKDKNSFSINSQLPGISNGQADEAAGNSTEIAKSSQPAANNNNAGMAEIAVGASNNSNRPAVLDKAADSAAMPQKLSQDVVGTFAKPDKTDPTNRPQPVEAKTIANQKSKWFLTFSAGTTQTVSFGTFNTAASVTSLGAVASYYANVPAITALSAYKYNISQPGMGFHISAGGLYQRQLSAHWNLSGGLSLAYLSNTQQTGDAYKGALDISLSNGYSLAAPQVTLQSYYQSGSVGTLVNKAWQVQVPLGLGYVFNPKGKTKFILNGGLALAWLLSSEWLIPDTRYDKLYYSKAVLNSTAVNWQIGPAIEFKNQWRFGLQYQQSFTSLAKNYVTPKLYWQNISIYTAIPLGRGKKRK